MSRPYDWDAEEDFRVPADDEYDFCEMTLADACFWGIIQENFSAAEHKLAIDLIDLWEM